jgi:hypothetical protein
LGEIFSEQGEPPGIALVPNPRPDNAATSRTTKFEC